MTQLKYEIVQQQLIERIRSGQLKPGERLKSELQLADEFDVSAITIRKAMEKLVDGGYVTRSRGAGTFVTEMPHVNAASSASRLIALMLTQERSSLSMMRIIDGIRTTLNKYNSTLLVDWNVNNSKISGDSIKRMLDQGVDGFLIYPYDPAENREEFNLITNAHKPYVLMDRRDAMHPSLYVGSSNFEGGFLAARTLLDMGHRKICFCGHLFNLSSEQERYAGFCQAMLQAGIHCQSQHLMPVPDWDELARRVRAGDLTAVFCCSDRIASRAVRAMLDRGLRVPEDLSIFGFDDNIYSSDNPIQLSTIRQNFETIGQRAVELLLHVLDSPAPISPMSILTDVQVVIRDSTRRL